MSLIHIKQIRNLPAAGNHSTIIFNGSNNVWSNASTAALQLPSGLTVDRPSPVTTGLLRFNTTTNRLEYVDNSLNWVEIQNTRKVTITFTNADLVSNIFTAVHNLGDSYPLVNVYDNLNNLISPSQTTSISSNITDIDLTGFTPITGTWVAVFVGG